jgi:hypothetical protein
VLVVCLLHSRSILSVICRMRCTHDTGTLTDTLALRFSQAAQCSPALS